MSVDGLGQSGEMLTEDSFFHMDCVVFSDCGKVAV